PPAVDDMVAAAMPAQRAGGPRAALEAWFALDHFEGKETEVGSDLRAQVWLNARFAAILTLGLRWGLSHDAPDGLVRSTSTLGGIGAAFTLTPPTLSYGLDAHAHVNAVRVTFAGESEGPARPTSGSGTAIVVRAGTRG